MFAVLLIIMVSGCANEKTWTSGSASVSAKGEKADAALFAMDTYMSLTVYSDDAYDLAINACERIFELEKLFDPDLPESEVSRLNVSGEFTVGRELKEQIETAALVKERSEGAFDLTVGALVELWGFGDVPKVPSNEDIHKAISLCTDIAIDGSAVSLPEGTKINLGASAKGYTSNELSEFFKSAGVKSALVSLGGNVQVVGTKPDGNLWRVAVQDPRNENAGLGVLSIKDCAVVTSGDYQRYFIEEGVRYCHILDPRTGMSVNNGVCAVTVMCDNGLMADCLSTAMMVLGKEKALEYWETWGGYEMLIVTSDNTVTMTPGFAASFEPDENLEYSVEIFNEE